ncbi:MAG: LptA/OstA family protein [Acidobacteriota bacterium]
MTARRAVEAAVLTFGALFVAFLVYSFRPGRRPAAGHPSKQEVPPSEEAGQATTVLKGFDYTETLRGKPLFHIQSERTVGFGAAAGLLPNLYALEKVALTVYPETGAPVTVHSEKATYDQRTNAARLKGNVRWIDGRGALGETAEVEFRPAARELVAPGALRVTRGTFVLEARSGIYDVAHREARLEGPVRGSGTGDGSGGLSALAADRAVYKRDEATVELSGNVSGQSTGGNRISSDRLVLKTSEEGRGFDWARAEGHVQGTIESAPLASPGAAGKRGRQSYAGERGGLLFAPDGSVRSLALSGSPASVDEQPGPGVPAGRKLRASSIDVTFEGGQARSARAQGAVRVETAASHGESDQAAMTLLPTGEVQTLELSGSVKMSGEGRSGTADRAVQVADRDVWVLTGGPGRSATVDGDGSRVSAARIEIDQKHKGVRAEGGARAVLVPRQSGGRLATPVGDSTRPTFGKADRMTFDDATRVATLSGNATLWQEGSSVFGNDITVNDTERSLVAVGNTRTVFSPADARKPAGAPAPAGASGTAAATGAVKPGARAAAASERDRHPSVVTARRLVYREVPGARLDPGAAPSVSPTASAAPAGAATAAALPATASFDGSVVVTSGPWHASANTAVAYIGPDRRIERVEMNGDVSFRDAAEGRSGRASKATDWPLEGRTVLEGAPAVVLDREGNRVAGATLTIAKRGGSVEVTAPEGGRTETIHRTRSQ